jgi:hypothetical protein
MIIRHDFLSYSYSVHNSCYSSFRVSSSLASLLHTTRRDPDLCKLRLSLRKQLLRLRIRRCKLANRSTSSSERVDHALEHLRVLGLTTDHLLGQARDARLSVVDPGDRSGHAINDSLVTVDMERVREHVDNGKMR